MLALALVRLGARELRERRIRLERIFVIPAILGMLAVVYVGSLVARYPDDLVTIAAATVVAIALGALVGVGVARFTTVRHDPSTGFTFSRGSYASLAIWIAALLLRVGARFAIRLDRSIADSAIANAALVVLLAAAFAFTRVRIRAKALEERAAHTAAPSPAL